MAKIKKQLSLAMKALEQFPPPPLGYEHELWLKTYDNIQKCLKDTECPSLR